MAVPLICSQSAEQADTFAVASPPARALRLLVWWHLASLDAPTVAVIWSLALAWTTRVHLDPWIPLLIACGTWTVYAGDRLLDAHRSIRSGNVTLLRERHYFHWRHRRKFVPLAAFTATISVVLILRLMPLAIREHDSVIAGAALAYFSGVHSRARFPARLRRIVSKEFLVGVLFTAGCAAPSFSHLNWKVAGTATLWSIVVCVAFFAVLAWLNCSLIESWESNLDRSRIRKFTVLICTTACAIAIALWFAQARASALIWTGVASALLLFVLDSRRQRITPITLRALADLVLLTPAVLILLGAFRG